jgi:hypothetical protein
MATTGEPRRLALEVRFDAQPIEGRLYEPDAADRVDRTFSGWLGLMAAIDAARDAAEQQDDGREGVR